MVDVTKERYRNRILGVKTYPESDIGSHHNPKKQTTNQIRNYEVSRIQISQCLNEEQKSIWNSNAGYPALQLINGRN